MATIKDVKTGDVLAFRGNSSISEVIERIEDGRHSHVAFAYFDGDELFVIESREFVGVRKIKSSGYLDQYKIDLIQTSGMWSPSVEAYVLSQIGHEYSYLAAVEVGLGLTPGPLQLVCSLFVADAFGLPRKGMTPETLVYDLIDAGCVLSSFSLAPQ